MPPLPGAPPRRNQDPIVGDIERRLAMWTKVPEENGEDIQVLRYENGQEYGAHWDWFDDPVKHADQLTAGNRVATVLMYLSGALPTHHHSLSIELPLRSTIAHPYSFMFRLKVSTDWP